LSDDFAALLGAVPPPYDWRDKQIAELGIPVSEALPASYFAPPVPPVLKQVGGTCVGFSTTTMRAQQERRTHGTWYPLDAIALYRECKKIDGLPNVEGSYVRSAMSVLKNLGQPTIGKSDWAAHKTRAYYAVSRTEKDIKNVIYSLGAIVVAGPWFESWFSPKAATGYTLPAPDVQAGGHAYVLQGFDDNRGFLVHNTWGREWASMGRAYMPYKYVPMLWEAWRAVDA
jgi:hypothetical protein